VEIAYCTVRVTVPLLVPDVVFTVAVIVEFPVATPVATPVVALIVATLVVPEDHATCAVTFLVELSANVAVAVSCTVDPLVTDAGFGVMSIVLRSDVFTITPPVAVTPSCEAVIVALPTVDEAVTIPAASTVADAEDDVHLAELVTSFVVPSTVVPLAVNCFVSPDFRKIDVGVTVMLFSAPPPTKKPLQLLHSIAKATTNAKMT
jgi:hypothetical protein